MSKAILVIDMPKNCAECPCYNETDFYHCNLNDKYIAFDQSLTERPNWCPLKEVPQKQTIHSIDTPHHRWAKNGYNACIDDILEGSE